MDLNCSKTANSLGIVPLILLFEILISSNETHFDNDFRNSHLIDYSVILFFSNYPNFLMN